MKYNFDTPVNRRGTASEKWDLLEQKFGEKDVLPLWVADMDFQAPSPVIEALKKRVEHGIYGYTVRTASYYQSIVGWLKKRHGWETKYEWFAYAPGVMPSIGLAIQAFTYPGDKIVVQPPVYPPFFKIVENNGRSLSMNPLKYEDGLYKMDLDDLRKKLSPRVKMLILCNPHNPVGRVWTRNELTELSELCLENDVMIVSDEIHSDLVLKGHKHTPMATISKDVADITLTCMSPSKTFNLAGLCTSSVIASDPKMLRQFNIAAENAALETTNALGIVASEAAYRYGEDWLEQLLVYVQGNVDYLLGYFKTRIASIKPVTPEGTYLVWLDCRDLGMNPSNLRQFLIKKAKVGLNDGSAFGPGGEGFQRINLACPRTNLEEALKRIENAVRNLPSNTKAKKTSH